ncbi:hypothetical protein NUH87_00680 [Pseudomonas batumici]|uniref:hypothetical protein n=1 Tax=Pseudomonas batumici TaxID=226910 RepID=UPI0030D35148
MEMGFTGAKNLDDVLASELDNEWNNPGLRDWKNTFQLTLAHTAVVVPCQKARVHDALRSRQRLTGLLVALVMNSVRDGQVIFTDSDCYTLMGCQASTAHDLAKTICLQFQAGWESTCD